MQTSRVQPYLYFSGRCEEALSFYSKALGATIDFKMHFHESPEPIPPGVLQPGFENKVMHASFTIGSTQIMCSDGCGQQVPHSGYSLALSVQTVEEAEKSFHALAEGGSIQMPLAKTFWSPSYGMLTDRFGIAWMIMTQQENPASGSQ